MTLWIATCGLSIFDPSKGLKIHGLQMDNPVELAAEINQQGFDVFNGSAELSGLKECTQDDSVILYASDTDEGENSARAVECCLKIRFPAL
jgi:CRISPR/Cas system-associated protein Csm6